MMNVSVVIPCRDAERYLAQTIGSALDQTHPAHEIIVIDDGSRDGSMPIARAFEAHVPARVRVAVTQGAHASRARNIGALLATGDALMFLDADDVLGPTTLEALVASLSEHPRAIAACTWLRLEWQNGAWQSRPPSCVPREEGQDPLSAWLTGWYHPPCSVLWSRAAFEEAGRWDEEATVNQDGDLVMRALACGIRLLETGKGTAYYRRAPAGESSLSSRRLTRDGLAARIRAIVKVATWLEDRDRLEPFRASLAAALSGVADDAAVEHRDLMRHARTIHRQYRPPVRHRLTQLAARRSRLRGSSAPRRGEPRQGQSACAVQESLEVRYGLHWADDVSVTDVRERSTAPVVTSPIVSVVIPSFNRAHVLPRTLASVRAQTFDAVEILVIDDGSADDTAAVVTACGDPRVRYLRQLRNMGVSAARNRGLREALGDFIAFLDSDDEWMPEKLERQVALFRRLPEHVGLLYTGVQSVREDGTTTIEQPADRGDVHREMLWHNVIHGGGSNVMIRRNVVATIGFFHEGLPAIEDYEYWLRITRAYAVDFVPEPLVRYHDRRDTMRRSLSWRANVDARWWLYRRHAREMRRAGVAHLFLLNTIRWAMNFPGRDLGEVRRLAARAVLDAPTSRMAVAMLLRTMVPAAGRLPWVQRHAALE